MYDWDASGTLWVDDQPSMRNVPLPDLTLAEDVSTTNVPFLRSLLRFSEPVSAVTTPFHAIDVAAITARSETIRSYGWDVSDHLDLLALPVHGPRDSADLVLALSNAELGSCTKDTVQSVIDFSRRSLRRGGFLLTQLRRNAPLNSERFIALCRAQGFPAAWRASPLFPADPFHGEHDGPLDLVIARQDMP